MSQIAQGSGLMATFQLQEEKVAAFLRDIENGYIDNPYHSAIHAAGVLQMSHMLIQNGLVQSGILDDNLQLSCYLAAICHDYCHPGLTNDFLIKTRHHTALVYNVRHLLTYLICMLCAAPICFMLGLSLH